MTEPQDASSLRTARPTGRSISSAFAASWFAALTVVGLEWVHVWWVGGTLSVTAACVSLGVAAWPLALAGWGVVGALAVALRASSASDARPWPRAVYALVTLATLVLAVQQAVVHFSGTMKKPVYQGLASGLAAAATLVVLWALRPVFLAATAHVSRLISRRGRGIAARPATRMRWLAWGVGALVAVSGVALVPTVRPEFATIDLRPAFMGVAWLVALSGAGLVAWSRRGLWAAGVIAGLAGGAFGVAVFALPHDHAARVTALRDTVVTRLALPGLGRAFDQDGDGTPGRALGGDCDDTDARTAPTAFDVPKNGKDENCTGADLNPRDDPFAGRGRAVVPSSAAAGARPKHVVLLTIDALRADTARAMMPNLAAFAAGGAEFTQAYAHGAATYWSVPSLVASTLPSRLEMGPDQTPVERETLLAEVLRESGYHTALFANVTVFFVRGLKQGCTVANYETSDFTKHGERPGAEHLTDGVLGFVDQWRQKPAKDRFFVWAHYYDPHDPYSDMPDEPAHGGSDRAKYEASVRYVDRHLGRLFDGLRARGVLDDALVVITADHGDEFGEHGHRFHGSTLYEEMVRVPLVVRGPGVRPGAVDAPVGHMDVAPTMLDLVGVAAPERWLGRSLGDTLRTGSAPTPSPVFFEILPDSNYGVHRVGARVGTGKAIYRVDGGLGELFDLATDPGERDNLWDRAPDGTDAARAQADLLRYLDQHAFALGQGKTGARVPAEGRARR